MGIWHVYIARGRELLPSKACAPLPRDIKERRISYRGRSAPPRVFVPLFRRSPSGRAVQISRAPGKLYRLDGNASLTIRDFGFSMANISIPQGSAVTWISRDTPIHDVTLANGPRAVASPVFKRGKEFTQRFWTPGTYRLFCTRHPLDMPSTVTVRRERR
jgi:plastocyanin